MASRLFSSDWLRWSGSSRECVRGLTDAERRRLRIVVDATCAALLGVESLELSELLNGCDLPVGRVTGPTKGFWRVDKAKDPELRHTVLALVAFHDLEEEIRACGGDRDAGIEAFLGQNDGEGWMLPDMLRIADYGLGYDERAKHSQPVASRLGPRFYDWQLAQSAEESWRECHQHARNLLGESGYRELLDEIAAGKRGAPTSVRREPAASGSEGSVQESLWP